MKPVEDCRDDMFNAAKGYGMTPSELMVAVLATAPLLMDAAIKDIDPATDDGEFIHTSCGVTKRLANMTIEKMAKRNEKDISWSKFS